MLSYVLFGFGTWLEISRPAGLDVESPLAHLLYANMNTLETSSVCAVCVVLCLWQQLLYYECNAVTAAVLFVNTMRDQAAPSAGIIS